MKGPGATSAPATGWRRAWGVARWAIAALLIGALVQAAAPRWLELEGRLHAPRPGWLLAALAGWLLSNALYVACWRRILAGLGHPLGYADAYRVLNQTNLAKYLPGSAWHFVGRTALAARLGVPPEATAASILLDVVVHLATGVLVGVPLLAAAYGATLVELGGPMAMGAAWAPYLAHAGWLAAAGAVAGVAAAPPLVRVGLVAAARLLRRPPVAVPFGHGFMLGVVALYALNWLVIGLAFVAFGQALLAAPLTAGQAGRLMGALPCAWVLGAVAVFAPAGLGVRELGLAALLLAPAFPPGWPTAVALASRLWFMAGEAIAFAVAARLPGAPAGPGAEARSPGD